MEKMKCIVECLKYMLVCIIILWKMFDRHLLYYPTPKKRKKNVSMIKLMI